ncbi:ATP-dependent DNA helicase DinG [Metabacillus sp. HB246100]
MSEQRFVVVDIETTGNAPKKGDKIIQIAAVVIENGLIVDRYMSFVNPLQSIPVFIEQLTGITNDMVMNAPTFKEIAHEIFTLIDGSYFVAHNVYFDLSFLQEEFKHCELQFTGPILDTVELTRMTFPTEASYKLSDLSEKFNMLHENPHRADSDAEATALLLVTIFQKIKSLPLGTLQHLLKLSSSFISDLDEVMDAIISERLLKAEDVREKEFETVRSLTIRKRKQITDENSKNQEVINLDEILDTFKNQVENIEEVIPKYHVRDEQIKMMKDVYTSLQNHQHSLMEAPTGFGKTIAYVLPAIIYSKKENKTLLISTYTNNLQNQIVEKEMDVLKQLLPFHFSASILKGQKHYLCLQKFEQSLYELDDNYDYTLSKAQILIWLTETTTGDLDELNLPSGGKVLWDQLHVDRTSFQDNPFSEYCYYQSARTKALSSSIIITTHAMLLMDMLKEIPTLPPYDEVIIDEAHRFERVASEQLGLRVSYLHIHHVLSRLGLSKMNGILSKELKLIEDSRLADVTGRKCDEIHSQLQEETHQFFSALHAYVLKRKKNPTANRSSYSFYTETENNAVWNAQLEMASRIQFLLKDYLNLLHSIIRQMDDSTTIHRSIKEKLNHDEFIQQYEMLTQFKENIQYLFFENDKEVVKWIEIDTKGAKNAVSIYAQPIQVTEYLADEFFAKKQSVILTSATLTVKGSFSYIIHALGLGDFYPETINYQSPFQFENQVKLFVPSDVPAVNEVTLDEYSEVIALNIGSVANITNGKLLVLFTSYEMLKKTYQLLKEDPTLEDFIIMGQGTGNGSTTRLTKNFKQYEQAILLGTNSFWEGVDFIGENLKALVIVRLPFVSPEEPLVKARSKKLEDEGRSSFYDYSLPEAILRFRQGFGRLIRNENDRGFLFVLDNRIIQSNYGKDFVSSIPAIEVEHKPMQYLTHSIENWITEE